MTLEGHVENGAIVLPDSGQLPEGARVRVEVLAGGNGAPAKGGTESAYERIKRVVEQTKTHPSDPSAAPLTQRYAGALGSAPDLPADMAERHDHYIHGSNQ